MINRIFKLRIIIFIVLLTFISIPSFSQTIFKAIELNDIKTIKKLSRKKEILDTVSKKYGTPLIASILFNKTKAAKILLKKGADINQVICKVFNEYLRDRKSYWKHRISDSERKTALSIAIKEKNIEMAFFLINNGANPKLISISDVVKTRNLTLVKRLSSFNDIDISNRYEMGQLIYTAFINKDTAILNFIINKRKNDKCLTSALNIALRKDKEELLYYLFRNFNLKEYTDSKGFNDVISTIIACNKVQALKHILHEGVELKNRRYSNYLVFKLASERDSIIMNILYKQGVSIEEELCKRKNVFDYCVLKNKLKVLEYLRDKNLLDSFDVNKVFKDGETNLIKAVKKGYFDIVKYLTEIGADINYRERYTALDYAIIHNNKEIAEYLNSVDGKTWFNLKEYTAAGTDTLYFDSYYFCDKYNASGYCIVKKDSLKDIWKAEKYYNNGLVFSVREYLDPNFYLENVYTNNNRVSYLNEEDVIPKVEIDSVQNEDVEIIEIEEDFVHDEDVVFLVTEKNPEFPGGLLALRRYIYDHLMYPAVARENDIQSTVYLRFVVMWDGKIGKIELQRGVDPLLDNEAIRVIKSLPRFKPGRQGGRPVSVWVSLPIVFRLN